MPSPLIVHINLASAFGGGEVQTLNLIKNLPSDRQIVIGKKNCPFLERLSEELPNIQVMGALKAIVACRKNSTNTVIHAHDGRGAHLARIISMISGCPYLITRRVNKLLKGKLSESTYRKADYVVGISKKVANNLSGLNSNVSIIYDSYSNLPSNKDEELALQAYSNKFVVTQIGSLIDIKNVPYTIELARLVERQYPDIHFLIVGEGKLEEELKSQAQGLSNVTFLGFTPYISSVLSITNLLIMPSKNEGLGSSILEAYQHNVPVVGSNVGGIPEIVEVGQSGFLVDLDNGPEEAVAHLEYVLSDKSSYATLREGVKAIKRKYSPETMVQSYQSIYNQLVTKP
ncbi:glycosyltransferase family 4 protein [Vibrio owensii]|uniref:glycosyltransferase family 4 protein n=1 Tax=Vibrio owensii TaxID=696485 RepID=UPI002FF13264